MSSDRRTWSEGMFHHLRRGRHQQALYHAAHGDPELMLQYYEGLQGSGDVPAPYDTPAAASPAEPRTRHVEINGAPLSETAWGVIRRLEQLVGGVLPDGTYWYDALCGAFGVWGEATWLFLPPHLPLAGPILPHCSGPPTGVFINGRDLHPLDLQRLALYTGPIAPGFYYLDALGNLGMMGQPPAVNLRVLLGL